MSEVTESAQTRSCATCNRSWGVGIACQFCAQVEGLPTGVKLASPGKRVGAHLLDAVLLVFTLYIGWIIWSLVIWSNGQSPAKQIMKMKVVKLNNSQVAGWGAMFLREVIAKPIGGFVCGLTLGILYFMPFWDKNKQELWDKIIGTVVVDDANDQLAS